MPVIGYNISSIQAEKRNVQTKKIDISSIPRIDSVVKKDLTFPAKQNALAIGFEFKTTYNPDIGQIKFVGELLYSNKNVEKILDFWNKKNKLPDEVDIEVKNFLFKKCLTLGINISENLQLPPPIMFPALRQKKDEDTADTAYIG
jgi:hypothetical protein